MFPLGVTGVVSSVRMNVLLGVGDAVLVGEAGAVPEEDGEAAAVGDVTAWEGDGVFESGGVGDPADGLGTAVVRPGSVVAAGSLAFSVADKCCPATSLLCSMSDCV